MTGRVLVAPPFTAPQSFAPMAYGVPAAPSPAPAAPYPAAAAVPTQPRTAAPTVAAAPRSATAPIVRGQIPDEPIGPPPPPPQRPHEMISLPTPEELGVGSTKAADGGIDWGTVNRRLEGLGATCFQMRRLPEGRWHIVCLLPTAQPNQTHRVEAEADAKPEAVRLALEQAEQWAGKR